MMRNTFKTFVLLASLGGIPVLFGSLVGGPAGMVIGLLFGLVLVDSSYWFSDRLAVRSAWAVPVAACELGWLRLDVVTLAERTFMQPPRLFISPDAQPNAFDTGRNERNAVVCVTRGRQMALSRSREYEADRLGAELAGDARPLASALTKIEAMARHQPMPVSPAQATACIVNPLTGRQVTFARLFLTHPPTEERVARLLDMPVGVTR